MSDSREALRSPRTDDGSRVRPLRAGWFATVAMIIAVGLGSFLFGIYISSRDLADSRALFTALDGGDAAPGNAGGKHVPEAVGWVIASGATLHDVKRFSGSLRLRYFGPRDLTSDGIYRSKATALLNAEVGYQLGESWRLSAEFLNLLNRRDHDIDYAYTSRITPTATPAFTGVFHPVEPFQVRIGFRGTF